MNQSNLRNHTELTTREHDNISSVFSSVSVSVTEPPPMFLIACLMTFALWITIVNALVLACLLMSKHALKSFVNIQILSFCVSDMIVGILAIPLTLTFQITSAFPYVEACASVFYVYSTAQTANLFHAFGICIYRLVTIKRRSGTVMTQSKRFKQLLYQILFTWIGSAFLVAWPYGAFARFGKILTECSFYAVFENDLKPVAIINIIFLIPQVGMSVVYVYMFRFLLTTWRRINTTRGQSKPPGTSSSNYGWPVDSKSLSEKEMSKHFKADESQTTDLMTTSQMDNLTSQEIYKITDTLDKATHKNEVGCVIGKGKNSTSVCETTSNPDNAATSFASDRNTQRNNKTSFLRKTNGKTDDNLGYRDQKDVLITIGLIVLVMNIFMTPMNFIIFAELFSESLLSRKVRFALLALSLMNSALNPFIYALRVKPFKKAFKRNVNRFASRFCFCANSRD